MNSFLKCNTPGGGGGPSPIVWWGGVQQAMKKWTQRDLRFCKNEGSKDLTNNNEKGGQQDRKSRSKFVQMTDFCEK